MRSKRLGLGAGFAAITCLGLLLTFSGYVRARAAGDSSWGFALTNLDTTCKPCDDFYEFAMGGWMKANPIPAEYATWGTFTQLRDSNLTAMQTILDAASKGNAAAGSNEQKIGAFYASCMDTSAIEAARLKPIEGELAVVNGITDRKSLDATIAQLQREGSNAVFRFGSGQDIKDSTRVIAIASQGGLGMPDRDYYLRDDEKSRRLRADYEKHIATMMELAGDPSDKAAAEAKTIMGIETALAKASRTRVELRDPEKNYNLMAISEMKTVTPAWSWGGATEHSAAGVFQGDESGAR
jgi:putative endopeptidase